MTGKRAARTIDPGARQPGTVRRRTRSRPLRSVADVSAQIGPDEDIADLSLAVWGRERPDLDASGKAITGRILRLGDMLLTRINDDLAPVGLNYSVYAILATLRTIGAPNGYRMSPSQLKQALTVSSGGMSNLLRKVEMMGYIRRTTDPEDGRGVIVELTRSGRVVCDRAMPLQAMTEQAFVTILSPRERNVIAKLLRRLIIANR